MMNEYLLYSLPKQLNRILGATTVETAVGEILLCFDENILYTFAIGNLKCNLPLQKFSIAFIKQIIPLTKSYFIIITQYDYLAIVEMVITNNTKIEFEMMVEWKIIKSYFIREVVDNMIELHIFYSDVEFNVYQFTTNGKMGNMGFLLTPQYKILKAVKKQLYGSKTFINTAKKAIYFLKTFQSPQFIVYGLTNIEKIMLQNYNTYLISFHGLSRTEQFFITFSNFTVVNALKQQVKHKILSEVNHSNKNGKNYIPAPFDLTGFHEKSESAMESLEKADRTADRTGDKADRTGDRTADKTGDRTGDRTGDKAEKTNSVGYFYDGYKILPNLDLLLVYSKEHKIAYIYQIKPIGSTLIGIEYGSYNWSWILNARLIGISDQKDKIKIVNLIHIKIPQTITEQNTSNSQDPNSLYPRAHKNEKSFQIAEQLNAEEHCIQFQIGSSKEIHINTAKITSQSNISKEIKIGQKSPKFKIKQEAALSESEESKKKSLELFQKKLQKTLAQNKVQMKYKDIIVKNQQEIIKSEVEEKNKMKSTTVNINISQEESPNKLLNEDETMPNKQPIPYERFKPTKIIQRKGVSFSKTIQKSKENQPIHDKPIDAEVKEEPTNQFKQEEEAQNRKKEIGQKIKKEIGQKTEQQEKGSEQIDKFEEKVEQKVGEDTSNAECQANNEEQSLAQNLSKSHAVLMGKLELTANPSQGSEVLNLFNSTINRNNIFSTNPMVKNDVPAAHQSGSQKKELIGEINPLLKQSQKVQPANWEEIDDAFKYEDIFRLRPSEKNMTNPFLANPPSQSNNLTPPNINNDPFFNIFDQNYQPAINLFDHTKYKQIQKETSKQVQTWKPQDIFKEQAVKEPSKDSLIRQRQSKKQERQQQSKIQVQEVPHQHSIQRRLKEFAFDHEEKYVKAVTEQFQKTTSKLLNSIEELTKIHASDKADVMQKAIHNLQQKSIKSLKEYITNQLTLKLEQYFKEIFKDSNQVYNKSLEFYKESAKSKIISLQIQFDNQEKVIKNIQETTSFLKISAESTIQCGQEQYVSILKNWTNQTTNIEKSVQNINEKYSLFEAEKNQRNRKYEDTKSSLDEIKKMLQEQIRVKQEKKNRKEQLKVMKEKQKIQLIAKEIERKQRLERQKEKEKDKEKQRKIKKEMKESKESKEEVKVKKSKIK